MTANMYDHTQAACCVNTARQVQELYKEDFEESRQSTVNLLKERDALKERLRLTDENLDSANQTNQVLCKKLQELKAANDELSDELRKQAEWLCHIKSRINITPFSVELGFEQAVKT